MFLMIWTASAAGLPWECPAITTPADADVYRDTDAGLDATWTALDTEARAWWDESCAWTETATDTTTTRTCTTAAGAVLTETASATSGSEFPTWSWTSDVSTIEVIAPSGPWTRIALALTRYGSDTGHDGSGGTTRTAAWSGTVADLPPDGSFEDSDQDTTGSSSSHTRAITTPDCSWTWSEEDGAGSDSVTTGGHTVIAYDYWMICGRYPRQAYVDGVLYGAVDWTTWVLDEGDMDGWSVADGDCDDTDPTVYPCAPEIALDGIDQDCDGGDLLDGDGDGADAMSAGGTDCDDTDADVFPGARDPGGDGTDGDCDGADDIDADGDGYTLDGDDRAADCDDTDPGAFPGAPEVRYDGVDQDCDGRDLTDGDGDGFDAVEAGGDDCADSDAAVHPGATDPPCDGTDQDCDGDDGCAAPPPDEVDSGNTSATGCGSAEGCGGSAAWLLLPIGLVGRRSRTAR